MTKPAYVEACKHGIAFGMLPRRYGRVANQIPSAMRKGSGGHAEKPAG